MADATDRLRELRAERRGVVLWGLQARTYHRAVQQIQTDLERHGLTVMEFDILAHVHSDAGLTQQRLAERLLVTKGNVTYQVDKLERQGLLRRQVSGRCKQLWLTPEGERLVQRAIPGQNALHARRFSHLNEAERDELTRLLRKVLDAPMDPDPARQE